MDATQFQPFLDLLQAMQANYATLGLLGAFSVLAYGLVRLWRLDFVQKILPAKLKWESWGKGLRFGLTFGLAFVGQLLAGLASGAKWYLAIAPAVAAGLGALGIRQIEKSSTGDGQAPAPVKMSEAVTPAKP